MEGDEVEKYKRLLRRPDRLALGPKYFVQAYVNDGAINSLAVTLTRHLACYLDQGKPGSHYTTRRGYDSLFAAVAWDDYAKLGESVIGINPWLRTWTPETTMEESK